MMKKFNVIDLFCGCGGFSKGFEEAGFNICFGIDMWKDATVTYQHNFSNAVVLNEDITKNFRRGHFENVQFTGH